MSVLVVSLTLVTTGVITLGSIEMASASQSRVRAQLAADAAALAAVAEGAPYGRGAHGEVAEMYAERNGGELISCACAAGARRVVVVVAVNGVRARAAAELDPALMTPVTTSSVDGLHPQMRAAVTRLLDAAAGAVTVVSGFRSTARQEQLWAEALARYGSPEAADDWVAPPGRSMHEWGLAVDLSGDLDLATRLIRDLRLPLYRPLHHEPWHFELVGSR